MKIIVALLIATILCVPALAHEGAHGDSDVVEVPDGFPLPSISIDVTQDSTSNWNVHLTTANFTFDAPDTSNAMGHGHAHVYVDGTKVGRAYGQWYYLGSLAQGCHDVEVHLNANNHANYVYNEEFIQDTKTVCVPTTDLGVHDNDTVTTVAGNSGNEYVYLLVLIGGIVIGYFLGMKTTK